LSSEDKILEIIDLVGLSQDPLRSTRSVWETKLGCWKLYVWSQWTS